MRTRGAVLLALAACSSCSSSSDSGSCSDGTYTITLTNFDGDCARYPQPKLVHLAGKTASITYVLDDGSELTPTALCFVLYSAGCGVDVQCSSAQHTDVFPVGGGSHKGLFTRSGAAGLSCSSTADISWSP